MGKNVMESKLTTREEKTKNTNRRELRKRISKMPPESTTNRRKSMRVANNKLDVNETNENETDKDEKNVNVDVKNTKDTKKNNSSNDNNNVNDTSGNNSDNDKVIKNKKEMKILLEKKSVDKLTNVKKSKKLKNEKNIRVRNVKNKKIGKGKMEEEKKDTSENVEKESSLPASPSSSSSEEEEEEDESNLKEYEVEKLIDIYMKKNNERKFLVRWKGYSSKHDTWEPEKHLNCKELINAFLKKLDKKVCCPILPFPFFVLFSRQKLNKLIFFFSSLLGQTTVKREKQ